MFFLKTVGSIETLRYRVVSMQRPVGDKTGRGLPSPRLVALPTNSISFYTNPGACSILLMPVVKAQAGPTSDQDRSRGHRKRRMKRVR